LSPHAKSKIPSDIAVNTNRARLRSFIRVICFVVAIVLLWPILPSTNSLVIVPALSPFVAIASLLGTRTFHALTLLGLIVGVVVLVRHRFFCRWICPVGLCVDGASQFGKRLGRRPMRVALLGQWIFWLTIGGALIGYPLLNWMDPLAIFSNVPFLVQQSPQLGMWLPATEFLAIVVLSIIWPQTWCNKICPLGAFQDLLFSARRYLYSFTTKNHEPDNKKMLNLPISRRTVLGITAGVSGAYVIRTLGAKNSHPLRPPGALDESRFAGVCTRCGNCLRVCPSGIIERDFRQNGWANLFTPVLCFDNDYCREDCIRCTEACPSGALMHLSLKEKTSIQIGLPLVDMNICLLGDDRECSVCKRWCPYDAIRYVFSQEEYTLVPEIDSQKCNGCGACEAACPTKPQKAIIVQPEPMH
jgi:MauM/NapG family ferredoxin protein